MPEIPQGLTTGQLLLYLVFALLMAAFGGGALGAIVVALINARRDRKKNAAETVGQELENEVTRAAIAKGGTAAEYLNGRIDKLLEQLSSANERARLAEADRDAERIVVKVRDQEIQRYRENVSIILINQGRAQAEAERYRDDYGRAQDRIRELETIIGNDDRREVVQLKEHNRQLTKDVLRRAGAETDGDDNDSGLIAGLRPGDEGVRE